MPDALALIQPTHDGSIKRLNSYKKSFYYQNNASATANFSGHQVNVVNNLTVHAWDDLVLTQSMINGAGVNISVQPGTYDQVGLSGFVSDVKYVDREVTTYVPDPVSGIFVPSTTTVSEPVLLSATGISVFAMVDADTFSVDSLETATYQNLFGSASPRFLGFNVFKDTFSDDGSITNVFRGFGVIDSYQVTAVPVPATFWLFASAMSALIFRLRKNA
ncbi:MAG: hypothetical protein Q8Q40_11430 [Methylococcaceae bacterium]|nr:hypothetical protein [Methylococcaceae bacterium]MDP3904572.1 hypothetical protein [Methylococcaceae bacterium]